MKSKADAAVAEQRRHSPVKRKRENAPVVQIHPAAPLASLAPHILDEGNERLQVSVHTLMVARDCRTRLLLRLASMIDAGEPPPSGYLNLLMGTWGHKAMAAWLDGRSIDEALAPYEAITDELLINEDRRGHANLLATVKEVVSRFPLSQLPFDLVPNMKSEISFVAPLGEVNDVDRKRRRLPVDLIGYIDRMVVDKHTGLKMPLEHKFTGKLDAEFIGRFSEYDQQTTAYMFAAEQVLGEKIGDAWVNAIEVRQIPRSDRKCKEHGVEYAECGLLHVRQSFIPARRKPAQLAEFQALALDAAERYIVPVARALQKRGPKVATRTPRDGLFTGACDYCEFRRWCLTSGRQPNLMNTMLKRNEGDTERLRSGIVTTAK